MPARAAGRGADPCPLREERRELRLRRSSCFGLVAAAGCSCSGTSCMQRRPGRYAVRYTNLDVLASVAASTYSWRRHLGLAVFLLALTALLVGFARPKITRMADREEATIVLVIDVSGSMSAKDVKPTRLEAAQVVVREFLDDLPKKFQVGVVSFSEQAEVRHAGHRRPRPRDVRDQLPLPAARHGDRRRARARRRGRARRVAARADPKNRPAAILLLSDGSQTEGLLLPLAGRRAREVVRHPDLHDRARHARGRGRVQPLRDEPHHPRAARSGDAQADRRRRRAAASTRPRAPATCARPTSGSARSSARSSASRRSPTRSSAPASCSCSRRRRSASSRSRGCRESGCSRRWRCSRWPAAAAGTTTRRRSTPARTVTVTETETETRTEALPGGGTLSIADAVERVLPSVVNVRTETFGGGKGEGSGVVFDRSGIIVTNNHVIEGTTKVNVAFNDGRHLDAARGHRHRHRARARSRRDPRRGDATSCRSRSGDSSSLRLGDPVIALGFPLGFGGPTVTQGIVSGLDRTVETGDGPRLAGPAPDRRGDQPRQLGRGARRPRGPPDRDQHGRRDARHGRERRLRDRDRRGAAGDRRDPARARRVAGVARDRDRLGRVGVGGGPARPRPVRARRARDGGLRGRPGGARRGRRGRRDRGAPAAARSARPAGSRRSSRASIRATSSSSS